jgi:hypothetical protein
MLQEPLDQENLISSSDFVDSGEGERVSKGRSFHGYSKLLLCDCGFKLFTKAHVHESALRRRT